MNGGFVDDPERQLLEASMSIADVSAHRCGTLPMAIPATGEMPWDIQILMLLCMSDALGMWVRV
jgi:hypothetical protein